MVPGSNGGWDDWLTEMPKVYFDGSKYMMWYMGQGVQNGVNNVGLATSDDGVTWIKYGSNPVLTPSSSGWDSQAVWPGPVVKEGDTFLMWYTGGYYPWQIGLATSPDGTNWQKYANNPVLTPGSSSWDSIHVTDPCVVRVVSEYKMWYVGYSEPDGTRAWSIGLALSEAAVTRSEWTFMVYMDADNDLESYGIIDFNEMEAVGSTTNVNVIVQIDRISGYATDPVGDWTGTRRYYVTKDTNTSVIHSSLIQELGESNMGDANTLSDFIVWSVTYYPAGHYCLVLWGHGGGHVGLCPDWSSDKDQITLPELKLALETVRIRIGITVNVLVFDACNMGMIEVAYQIRDYAKMMVGSEERTKYGPSMYGFPFDTILTDLTTTPNMVPRDLAIKIVEDYGSYQSKTIYKMATLSAIDLSKITNLAMAVDNFAKSLAENLDTYKMEIKNCRETVEEYGQELLGFWIIETNNIDLCHFAKLIKQNVPNTNIQDAATEIITLIESIVIKEWHASGRPNSYGLSIFYPDQYSNYNPDNWADYENTDFSEVYQWNEFLKAYIKDVDPVTKIEIRVSAPKNVSVGSEFTINVLVRNVGNLEVDSIIATIKLPKGFTLRSGETPSVNIPIPLNQGESYSIVWHASATKKGTYKLTFTAEGIDELGEYVSAKQNWKIEVT